MKKSKKIAAVVAAAGLLAVTGSAYAAAALPLSEAVSGLTGKSTADLYQERQGVSNE